MICTSKGRRPYRASGGCAHDGEGRDQQVVEAGALIELLAELGRLGAQLLVGQRLDLGLEIADGGDGRLHAFDVALVFASEDFGQGAIQHAGRTSLALGWERNGSDRVNTGSLAEIPDLTWGRGRGGCGDFRDQNRRGVSSRM